MDINLDESPFWYMQSAICYAITNKQWWVVFATTGKEDLEFGVYHY